MGLEKIVFAASEPQSGPISMDIKGLRLALFLKKAV